MDCIQNSLLDKPKNSAKNIMYKSPYAPLSTLYHLATSFMVLVLDGYSEFVAHIRRKIGYFREMRSDL